MKENLQLKKQLAELQKENDFLKKAAAFFAKEIEKLIIIKRRMKSKTLFEKYITLMAELVVIEPYMRI